LAVTPVATISTAPAAAKSALSHAMSKIGSPYRYGAAGPNAFDCSGLVSWAFKQAGVSLPRTSRAMSKVGKPVAKSDLRPGDLVFFYKPVSHVAIYIGGGKVVHASTRKSPVKISDLNRMPFNSARRV
jgi:cell wall-associated NlpC family hydrolase